MARKTFAFALLALMAITAHWNTLAGQAGTTPSGRFDWAHGYTGTDSQHGMETAITNAFADAEGNVYFAGRLRDVAVLCGDTIFGGPVGNGFMVGKMSADGRLLWHHIAYTNGSGGTRPNGLMPMGDTAVMLVASISVSGNEFRRFYWFDTLMDLSLLDLRPCDSIDINSTNQTTAFVTFGTDGAVLEEHFLDLYHLDTTGQPLGGWRYNNTIVPLAATLDAEGNIIVVRNNESDLCHWTSPWIYPNDSLRGDMVVVVDGRRSIRVSPGHNPLYANLQLMRFTPHFDSVTLCRYVACGVTGQGDTTGAYLIFMNGQGAGYYPRLKVDSEGNIYLSGTLSHMRNRLAADAWRDILLSPTDTSLHFRVSTHEERAGFLVKFAPDGTPLWTNQTRYTGAGDWLMTYNHDIQLDEESGTLYLMKNVYSEANVTLGAGDTASHPDFRNVGFVRLSMADGSYRGSAFTQTMQPSNASGTGGHSSNGEYWTTMAVQNNHVLMQCWYMGVLVGPDSNYCHYTYGGAQRTLALLCFDTTGVLHSVYDFGNYDGYCFPGATLLNDSVLYLIGARSSSAALTFGDTTIYNQNYIVRYVDTSLMSPYSVPTDPIDPIDTGDVRITLVDDGTALVAYPNPFRQSVKIKVESGKLMEQGGTVTAILTDLSGRREEVRLTPDGPNRYTLDLTSRPQSTYLLTLTTADGRQHTVRLLKQSDIFGW